MSNKNRLTGTTERHRIPQSDTRHLHKQIKKQEQNSQTQSFFKKPLSIFNWACINSLVGLAILPQMGAQWDTSLRWASYTIIAAAIYHFSTTRKGD